MLARVKGGLVVRDVQRGLVVDDGGDCASSFRIACGESRLLRFLSSSFLALTAVPVAARSVGQESVWNTCRLDRLAVIRVSKLWPAVSVAVLRHSTAEPSANTLRRP
ncbi:MAG: hypothetical protein WCG47_09005, partial [Dermatophilaceae bacterium]